MSPIDIVNQYYLRFGEDETACAKEYFKKNENRHVNKKIKKIAIYNPIMKFGGIGRVISLMLPIYESMDYEVILITEDISEEDYKISDMVKRFTIANAGDIRKGKKSYKERAEDLMKILTQEKVDVLIHHGVNNPFFVYDIMLSKLLGIYTIAERHQVFTEEFCRLDDLFFRQAEAFRMLDKLVVLTNADVLYWKSLGIDACYIENPFNSPLNSLEHDPHSENIVWVGRLEPVQKQYLDVLDIAQEVIVRRPDARFLMYGYGGAADKNAEQLSKAILEKGLKENVFYCGYQTDVDQIYRKARIHLVTSAFEAFPMGIYESRICGIPLVMYELPYLELLKRKKGYLAVPNGDIKSMAKNICNILEDEKLEKKLQTDAKESVKIFNNDIVRDKWKKLFNEIERGIKEIDQNREFGIIIQTIHKHFSIAQRTYNDLLWAYEQERVVYNVNKGIKAGKQLVLCPYGMIGKKVKKMLNENGIYETYIVDNMLSKNYEEIKSFDEIKAMDCSNMFFVICSIQDSIKQLFYEKIKALTSEDNIVFHDDEINI